MSHLLSNTQHVVLLGPTTSSTANSTSAVLDLANYEGAYIVAGVGDAAAACAISLIAGSSAACEGSTLSTISVSTADHCAVFDLHNPTHRYAKVLFGPGAGAVDGAHVHAILYTPGLMPVTSSTTSVAGSTLIVGSSAN